MKIEPFRTSAIAGILAVLSLACSGGSGESGARDVVSADPMIVSEPEEGKMFLGLRTVAYEVDDLEKAKEWYSQVLGFVPYFDEPFYVGFNVGGFELGLHPVEELGAPVHSEIQDVGEGILVASVIDPFGNLLGIIQNPHYGK
jgi:predicted enzyme related to lactoylglutathione lyase